jgi:hypothetical protein
MTHANLQKVRSYLATLEAILAKSQAGWASDESLLEFRRVCWAALLVADDSESQEQIELLVQYSKDLFSKRGCMDLLRDRIGTVLRTFSARLNGIERGYGKRWRDLRAA